MGIIKATSPTASHFPAAQWVEILSKALSFCSLVILLISFVCIRHQFLGTKITETNKLLKTDANKAY